MLVSQLQALGPFILLGQHLHRCHNIACICNSNGIALLNSVLALALYDIVHQLLVQLFVVDHLGNLLCPIKLLSLDVSRNSFLVLPNLLIQVACSSPVLDLDQPLANDLHYFWVFFLVICGSNLYCPFPCTSQELFVLCSLGGYFKIHFHGP